MRDAVLSEMADKFRSDGYEVIFATKDEPLRKGSFEALVKDKDVMTSMELEDFHREMYFGDDSDVELLFISRFLNYYRDVNNCGLKPICSRAPYTERECSLAELRMYCTSILRRKKKVVYPPFSFFLNIFLLHNILLFIYH